VIKVAANRNSFQAWIIDHVATAMMPGRAMGTITIQKACQRVQPSIRAASSRENGTCAKKPRISQTHSGNM
jgi:hypothetical protein